jgi:hypothetical protein
MVELDYTDRSFHKDNTSKYILSLQADWGGLSYCVFNSEHNNYIVFRKIRFEEVFMHADFLRKIGEVFETEELMDYSFKAVLFLSYSQQSTLVPSMYYHPDQHRTYLDFSHTIDPDDEIYGRYVSPLDAYCIYAIPQDVVALVSLKFSTVDFSHQSVPFLYHLSKLRDALSKSAIHVGLNHGFFDVAVTGGGKLKLYNTFQYVNENDLLYYVMYVCKQLEITTGDIPLILSGELSSKLTYYDMLAQYFPGIRYDAASGIPMLALGLQPLASCKYLNLLNLHTCALSEEHTAAES